MSNEQDDVVALPPVEADPVFVAAVEDAMSGPATAVADPNRTLGADPHDFAGLYIRHRSSFASHARRFLRDPRDVDEVVQEAFLRLFLALPELSTELQALAYCRRTVTNLCIDRYRADKRRPRLVNIDAVPQNDFAEAELDDPVVQAEDAAFVREALSLLTPLHREALVKREIEEKSIPVIAEELGVPEESVKHLLHRARRALRRHLAKTHLAPGANLDDVSTLALLA
ncbi:MAG: RNA polymerase sigma factor, partial [Actinobacteria bacterium]|nr:RNA polymerase sigma factor [Actinomycetota bacterium]